MSDKLDFKVEYKDGIWYALLPYEAQEAAEQLKGAGWKFHWSRGHNKCPNRCGGCQADIPSFARFTWLAERAAPFRDHFTPEAEKAFKKADAKAKKERDAASGIYDKSFAASDADVTIATPVPSGLEYRPYQRTGIQWIVERDATLLGDPPGLGKTIQVLGAVNALPDIREVLVIAPSALAANWAREANRWVIRPVNAVFMKDSGDIPPPAKRGHVNVMSMAYDSVPQSKGADISKVLRQKTKLQTDNMGLRRALKKVASRPSLRRILVVADTTSPIDWKAALTPKLKAEIGTPKIFICKTREQLVEAQSWMVQNPKRLAVAIIAIPAEEIALAAIAGGTTNLHDPLYSVAMRFSMPAQRKSMPGKHSSGYDLVVKDQVHTMRTMGRGLGLIDDLMQRRIDMLVLDESHVLNNPKNETSIGIFGEWDRENKQLKRGLADNVKDKKVYLTGTPLRNVTCELWGQLRSLAPKTFNNFWRFGLRYCDAQKNDYGKWTFDGSSNEDELNRKLRSGTEHGGLLIRRKKADVLKDLPPKTRIVLPLTPPQEAEKIITDEWVEAGDLTEEMDLLETQAMIAELEGDEGAYKEAISKLQKAAQVSFDRIARERARLGKLKVKPSVEFIEGLLNGGTEKVGVYANHRVVVDGLTDGLRQYGIAIIDGRAAGKGRIVTATGEPKIMDRIDVVDTFQNDPNIRIFIGNYKAAKEGWTLTAASTAVMVESTWTSADNEQAEDRFHRIGTVNPVTIYYPVFDGSLDQKMLEAVVRKMETADAVLDAHYEERPAKPLTEIERVKLSETMVEKAERKPFAQRKPTKVPSYTEEQRQAAHQAIQMIASVCDGAHRRDCQGFSGRWVQVGHWLAGLPEFNNRQTHIALRPITYHQRQVPEHLLEILKVRQHGQAAEPPVRYSLRKKGTHWYVEMLTTEVDRPVQRKVVWAVASHEGDLVDGKVLAKAEDAFVWDGGRVTVHEKAKGNFHGLAIPEPKTKKAVRWKNGHWQRELASGWKDFEPKWIDDPTKATIVRDEPKPKAATPKPKAATPKPKAATPKPKAATPKPKAATPKPKAATPKPKAATPKPKAATPKPKPKAATPKPKPTPKPTPKAATPPLPVVVAATQPQTPVAPHGGMRGEQIVTSDAERVLWQVGGVLAHPEVRWKITLYDGLPADRLRPSYDTLEEAMVAWSPAPTGLGIITLGPVEEVGEDQERYLVLFRGKPTTWVVLRTGLLSPQEAWHVLDMHTGISKYPARTRQAVVRRMEEAAWEPPPLAKAATPKPKPKTTSRAKPKTTSRAKPKTTSRAKPKRRSVPQPVLRISDPHAFEVLSDLEGPTWAELQRRDEGRYKMDNGFHLNLAAYHELAAMGDLAEGLTLSDLDAKAGLLEGARGTVYVVMPKGEIMLLADTTTKTKARKAAKIMQVIEE
jgi:SNF2-related domain/Helicase conserved C-terminal domain